MGKKAITVDNSDKSESALKAMPCTRVLRMSNMVTEEDLTNEEAFEEPKEDILEECNEHGSVLSLIIPRPSDGSDNATCPGQGYIFVQFANQDGAEKTKNAVSGRTFGGNPVVVFFYPESLFMKGVLEVPADFVPGPDNIEDENAYSTSDDTQEKVVDPEIEEMD